MIISKIDSRYKASLNIDKYLMMFSLIIFISSLQFARVSEVTIVGMNKLESINYMVGNLLKNINPAIGQWHVSKESWRVIPFKKKPSAQEKLFMTVLTQDYKKRSEVVNFDKQHIKLRNTIDNSSENTITTERRENFFSKSNLLHTIEDISSSMGGETKEMKIVNATLRDNEVITIKGRSIKSLLTNVEMLVTGKSPGSSKLFKSRLHIKVWFSKEIPIDGVAKAETIYEINNAGETIKLLLTIKVIDYSIVKAHR